jgi:hypothetical protein
MRYLALIVFVIAACPAAAAGQTQTATLNAAFSGMAKLSLSAGSLSFPDADPDTVPQVPSTPATVTIVARGRAALNGAVTVTVLASDDLRSGISTLPASTITWTATGAGFVAGTLSKTTPQPVGTWTGSGVRSGTQSFFFQNLWTHPTGTYTLTLLYTLSAA